MSVLLIVYSVPYAVNRSLRHALHDPGLLFQFFCSFFRPCEAGIYAGNTRTRNCCEFCTAFLPVLPELR